MDDRSGIGIEDVHFSAGSVVLKVDQLDDLPCLSAISQLLKAAIPCPAHPYTRAELGGVTSAVRDALVQLSSTGIQGFRGWLEQDHFDFLPASPTKAVH